MTASPSHSPRETLPSSRSPEIIASMPREDFAKLLQEIEKNPAYSPEVRAELQALQEKG